MSRSCLWVRSGMTAVLAATAFSALAMAEDLAPKGGVQMAQAGPPAASAPAPSPQGPWEKLAPFPEGSEELYGIPANGKLYVFGGLAPGWKPKALVFEYDPGGNVWTQKKPMALPSHHVALAEVGGKIYVMGGFVLPSEGPAAWAPIDKAWEYDPQADTWKALAPMPSKRGAAAATALNGKVYVIGGATVHEGSADTSIHPARPHRAVGTVEEYDPASNTWRKMRDMPTARNHHAVAAVKNKIYAIGGRMGAAFIGIASNTDTVEESDPSTNSWGALKLRMPTPRSAIAWGVHNNRIYVAGGEFQDNRMFAAFRAVEAYEPATNRWFVMPSMAIPRHGLASGVVGDRLHLVSGDVQSAGTGAHVDVDLHDALRLEGGSP